MNLTQWGITVPKSEQCTLPELVEIDPWDSGASLGKTYVTVKFSHWYLSGIDPAEQWDREEALLDSHRKLGAEASVVSVPPRLLEDSSLSSRVQSLLRRTKGAGIELYFDFGQIEPLSWISKEHCVYDPLWFKESAWGFYWKVHGWHPDRWVRMYSEADLAFLARRVEKYKPRFVILGHSKRLEQLQQLMKGRINPYETQHSAS